MDNFKTVAAVLVVLVAFTGFQLIANYSLRKAVRNDVEKQMKQIETSEAEMLRLRNGLKQATQDLEKLHEAVTGLDRLNELAKQIETLAGAVDTLKAKLDAAAEKAGALQQPADELGEKIGALDAKISHLSKGKELDVIARGLQKLAADASSFDKPVARIRKALAELDARIAELKEKASKEPGT